HGEEEQTAFPRPRWRPPLARGAQLGGAWLSALWTCLSGWDRVTPEGAAGQGPRKSRLGRLRGHAFPFRVTQYAMRHGSGGRGGAGLTRGGDVCGNMCLLAFW